MRQLLPHPADDVDLLSAYAVPDGRHVRANFVSSADGAATLHGVSDGLSGPPDKRVFGTLRTLADVVLVGAGTARSEGYGPAKASAERQEWRTTHGYAAVPPIAVVSTSARLDITTPFFTAAVARPIVYTLSTADASLRSALAEVSDVVTFDGDRVPVGPMLDDLAARGLCRVLCEGGPHLFADVVAAGCLDELALTVSPLLAGGGLPRITEGAPLAAAYKMVLGHVLTDDGFLFLRYVRTAQRDA